MRRLLIANRGEVAIRVARAAAARGLETVGVFAEDDVHSLHLRHASTTRPLTGAGAGAYLDAEALVAIALETGCDAVHPGWGFLSESASFARRCRDAGLTFVGPPADVLEMFGDKVRARAAAHAAGVPVLQGSDGPVSLDEAAAFLAALGDGGTMLVKAVAGGGGRGILAVRDPAELADAYDRCRALAASTFGSPDVYVERYLPQARHIEVQIAADDAGSVTHLWERDCSIQRRHQKLLEVAPSPLLPAAIRDELIAAAITLARASGYRNLGTVEFLVDAAFPRDGAYAFIEVNPRLQVEHTVTEQLLSVDLVRAQLALADGATLAEAGLNDRPEAPTPGYAVQARVNLETMTADGGILPAVGALSRFEPPSGPGVRVDTHGYGGYEPPTTYDSLLAKVIVTQTGDSFGEAADAAARALAEFRLEGVESNLPFLRAVLADPEVRSGRLLTRLVDDDLPELVAAAAALAPQPPLPAGRGDALGLVDAADGAPDMLGDGAGVAVVAPMQGTVVVTDVRAGDTVGKGQRLFVLEAMKMEHAVTADVAGTVVRVEAADGDTVARGFPLVYLEASESDAVEAQVEECVDLDRVRPDLEHVEQRQRATSDAARPAAVAKRHALGKRTARENVADLVDPGTWREYGSLAIANRRSRHTVEELIEQTPADGLVAGIGEIDGRPAAVLAYDYTVLAGTQGGVNHRKTDRLIQVAEAARLPVVVFAEGGGGRPGDDSGETLAATVTTFHGFARLSGLVPLVGIASGRCFAGNASLFGCCDVTIATADTSVGMGGPAMIEGGGLGSFRPEEVGPVEVQSVNGVLDVTTADEAEAVAVAKQYLGYFAGPRSTWEAADQRLLRHAVPENRLRVYDVRSVVETLADTGSVLELRREFAPGMITALARVEGRPLGIVANNPVHLAGAIESDGADKAARFLQLCDAFGLPIVFLCDTPGMMVGPDAERTALVRHSSRLFVVGANLSVPCCTIVLRKAYGLGAIAMAGGSFHATRASVSWPTGEFFGMGIEGAVKLGYRRELEAIADPAERQAAFERMVAQLYDAGKATSIANDFGIDDVIDPAESRDWIRATLGTEEVSTPSGKRRPYVDAW